jgi:ADP-ribose pyrophosphatase YjhB (NUDIX family)
MVPNESGPVASGEQDAPFVVPRIPASSGAMIFDRSGRLLIANPTYKDHWTIPGGIMEDDGETPWEACRREVLEEVGLVVETGRLAAVDFLHPKRSEPGGMRFLFDCGALPDTTLAGITLQETELSEHRLVDPARALELLSGPLRRRVGAALAASECVYLEDGRPVAAVTGGVVRPQAVPSSRGISRKK